MKKANKPVILPNSGTIEKVFKGSGGVYYKNTVTGKFATKKDFIKSNYIEILKTPLKYPKEIKQAKGYKTYYNTPRFNGKTLNKQVAEFLTDTGFTKSDKKYIKAYQKETGFLPDLNFIFDDKTLKVLTNNFFFTFTKNSSYNLESGFLNIKNGDLNNVVRDLAFYRKKGYKLIVIDTEGNKHDSIQPIKDFEKKRIAENQDQFVNTSGAYSDKTKYLYNIEHQLTVNDKYKYVEINLGESKGFYSDK